MKYWILALVLASLAFAGPVRAADPSHELSSSPPGKATSSNRLRNIDVTAFEKMRSAKTNVVLDVRTPKEYAAGHIPGAINLDVNAPDFAQKAAALDPKMTYLVHCAAGVRSARACEKLGQIHFDQVYNLDGGMRAWEKAGNKPVRKESETAGQK